MLHVCNVDHCSDGSHGSGLQVSIRVLSPAEVQTQAALFHVRHWFLTYFFLARVPACVSSSAT